MWMTKGMETIYNAPIHVWLCSYEYITLYTSCAWLVYINSCTMYMWQSREIKDYSVMYCITTFEVPYCWTSFKGRAYNYTHFVYRLIRYSYIYKVELTYILRFSPQIKQVIPKYTHSWSLTGTLSMIAKLHYTISCVVSRVLEFWESSLSHF